MKISIISGSHRQNSQSIKVAKHIKKTLLKTKLADETYTFNLAGNPLPLWDEGIWEGNQDWKDLLNPISKELSSSDAFVIIAPEYHGQVPAALKTFFLMWKHELSHKPALIVAVSSADGGSYPVAELRMSSYKNNRLCYIPEHLILRNVESILNDNEADNNTDADSYFRERIQWTLGILKEYALALKQVRNSGATQAINLAMACNMESLEKTLAFIVEIEKLKAIQRKTRPVGLKRYENSAEHSWHVCLSALMLKEYANEKVNIDRVIKMLLIHDLGEIDAGDTIVYASQSKEVKLKEKSGLERVLKILPKMQSKHYISLWEEFEEGKTTDSKFAKAIDRIPPLLHNIHGKAHSWKENDIPLTKVLTLNQAHISQGSNQIWKNLETKIKDVFTEEGLAS